VKIERYREAYKLIQAREVVCTKKTPRSFYFDVAGFEVILTHYWDDVIEDGIEKTKEIYNQHCTCKEMIFPVGRVRGCKHILASQIMLTSVFGPALRKRWVNLVDKTEDMFKMMPEKDKLEFMKKCGLIKSQAKEK